MAANDQWLRPLKRRVIVFVVAAAMFAAEAIFFQEDLWLFLFGAITAWAGYDFFFSGKYSDPPPGAEER